MALHFSKEELVERRNKACAAMAEIDLDGMLIFRQESMFYLTDYDTFGYVFFQCLYLGADGVITLLTRAPDLLQAQHTSVVEDIRIWVDAPDAAPAGELADIPEQHGLKGKRLDVEWESYGLTARNGQRLSAELADDALDAAAALAEAGALEGDILAAMHSAIFKGAAMVRPGRFVVPLFHRAPAFKQARPVDPGMGRGLLPLSRRHDADHSHWPATGSPIGFL